ncbi:hypothetical protein F5144DRAFT_150467 [Chaetomium tenue]|uniref:Uncharacterized protein n=1 Tax=Chaetomium tenue TaxID=1854479 RepID=A0ACB7PPC9_9PEZI|nr:hypothetical protein F5144DRAFT_150467 [Chaetomium globosum]
MTRQGPDLRLGNHLASPNFEHSSPAATQPTTGVPASLPETLSPVASKPHDATKNTITSPVSIPGDVGKPHTRARSRTETPIKSNDGPGSAARSNTPTAWRSPSESRLALRQRRDPSPTIQVPDEKVKMYLYRMAPPGPTGELAKENRSLHQRIAALQRTETDLLNENQNLAHKLASTQKRYDSRQKRWKQGLIKMEDGFRARIKDLEHRLSQQEAELSQVILGQAGGTTLDDPDIISWFVEKESTWQEWAHDFAHPDPDRVRAGLHPLHLRELCKGVKDFVRLADHGELPEELLATVNDGVRPARLLLHGMLVNFIISETLKSPFWVFDVISADALDLESPSVPRLNSMSPIGFRMDLAMWNFNISPPREARSPRPAPMTDPLAEPQNMRKPPRLITSTQPPGVSSDSVIKLSGQSLPSRQAMESLYQVLSDFPGGGQNADLWRASVMKTFFDGGMSAKVDNFSSTTNNSHLPLADARLKYAGQLKDRFLRGPARFLLQHQEAKGIEKLEYRLVQEIDAALRFSCQLWCRRDTPLVRGLRDLTDETFNFNSNEMQLYPTRAPLRAERAVRNVGKNEPHACHVGHPVIMVLQPSISVRTATGHEGTAKGRNASTRIWTKASVLVSTPNISAQESPLSQQAASPDAASFKAVVEPLMSPTASLASPMAAEESVMILPSMAFKNVPRPLLKQSPNIPLPMAT